MIDFPSFQLLAAAPRPSVAARGRRCVWNRLEVFTLGVWESHQSPAVLRLLLSVGRRKHQHGESVARGRDVTPVGVSLLQTLKCRKTGKQQLASAALLRFQFWLIRLDGRK